MAQETTTGMERVDRAVEMALPRPLVLLPLKFQAVNMAEAEAVRQQFIGATAATGVREP